MILSGSEILKRYKSKEIIIDPFNESRLGPNSYNLTLFDELIVYDEVVLDMKKKPKTSIIKIDREKGLLLEPSRLYLGRTNEYTETHNLVPMLEGRSSIGRLGICIHVCAGFGDIGHCGNWTLELFCIHPVRIYPDVEICQIYYHTVEGDIDKTYKGKYQNSSNIQPSLLYKEFLDHD